jgi:helicase
MPEEVNASFSNGNTPCLRGLFIGLNRTASPRIPDLASAVRDADALHALFEDNLGGTNVKIVDEAVTRDRLIAELDRLTATASSDDVVVITFSGHGTDTHELVTYDASPFDFSGSCLSLNELTDRISAIEARHLLVILDCCFSGGAGSKVLHAPLRPRSTTRDGLLSTSALLEQMAGTGRLILTASTAEQPAYEDPIVGHGLLTYHLLQALLGPDEVVENGQVSIYSLLSYVTTKVIANASGTMAARQEPTLRGQMDGAITWPIFEPGSLYRQLFPERSNSPVTDDIQSLKGHGIAEVVLDRWSASLPSLNELQQAVVNNTGLLDGQNVLVSAPTSSGKTMLGELAALSASQRGGRSVFLLPTRALVNEQYDRFTHVYGDLGVRVIRVTGEISDQLPDFALGQFDIALLTYEKFTGLALASSHILRLASVIVIDEVQTLVDGRRGPNLELLLTTIKARREEGIAPQLVCLSAVLGDYGGLDSWLEAHAVRWTKRPVQLREGIVSSNGTFRFLEDGEEKHDQLNLLSYAHRAKDFLIPLIRKLVAEGQQVIVFRNEKGLARGSAGYLARSLQLPAADEAISSLPVGDPSVIAQDLRRCLQGGIAFHVADLERDEKRVVEEFFRRPNSPIRVIVATTTLAQGVNLPAETVIIAELDHPIGQRRTTPYTVAEYKNIAGRAGRLGFSETGTAIVLSYGVADENDKWQRYITGSPEDITSCLLRDDIDLYTLLLRVVSIASTRLNGAGITAYDAITVLSSSFASHQSRLLGATDPFEPSRVTTVLSELQVQAFIEGASDGTLTMSPLGRLVARSGITVRSALNVANVLHRLSPDELNRATIITIAQLTEEVDQVLFPVSYKGYQSELRTFLPELQRQEAGHIAVQSLSNGAHNEPSKTACRAKKAVASLLWMNGTPAAQFEPLIMQHLPGRDAVGPVRALTSRTRDVIDTVIAIAQEIHPNTDLDKLADVLPVQLELGVPLEVVPIAKVAGATLPRQVYLNLAAGNLTNPEAILNADHDTLAHCVGNNLDLVVHLRRLAEQASTVSQDIIPSLEELLSLPVD